LWGGIALAMLGSAVVGYEDLAQGPQGSLLGNGLALLGSVCASGYLLAGRLARRTVALEWYAVTTNAAAALLLLPLVWLTGAPLWGLPAPTWGMFLLIAAVPQLIGHNSLVWALRHVSAPVVALVILAEPIGSGALAWWVFGERPSVIKLVGAALLLSGIFLASLKPSEAKG
jgi:drug/metabolite transporter (DMT)-like permease